MRHLHIIMPMAGEGSRFLKEGWIIPKPLIDLNGVPLFKHAISSVAAEGISMKYSFIVRQEHIDKYAIDKQIKEVLSDANIFSVLKTTRGAVETCLMAESVICSDDSIIVMDCDLEFRSKEFTKQVREILSKPVEQVNGGLLVSFTSNLPKYSYAEVDDNNVVIRTAEKEVISNHALCGAYFFSTAKGFLKAAHRLLNDPAFTKPEFYVSLLYNYLLENHETVRMAQIEEYYSYGTPEELKIYL
ncbi:glycosyltransferase family 2 protein [Bacteroides ihuae]|uniref:glycosyltransferase family 2 protein n=1 Tax=Bacteroides ihuae TaxID=1852362 RepID=UPI0008DB30D9|nr:glycosyltransferase family 2 protein [Bacteroides ihuae]